MLNEYLPNSLLKEEQESRSWLIKNVEKDDTWLGGNLIVPFKSAQASAIRLGGLVAAGSIQKDVYQRGSITTQPEAWGSLEFNHRDLMEHGKLSEQNLLRILPDMVDDFSDYMKTVTNLQFLNGPSFATLTADGTIAGLMTVNRPDRFVLNQLVYVDDDDSAPTSGYVDSINMETKVIHLVTTLGGAVDVDLSGYAVAQNAKVYFDGYLTQTFTSLKSSLLSAANGGSATLYSKTKTTAPYLQAIQVNGAAWSKATILDDIFDGFTDVKVFGKGRPDTFLCGVKILGWIMQALEVNKGAFHIVPDSEKVTAFGWSEIKIRGVKGLLTVVGLVEMDDDWATYLDMRALKLYSNGFFRKRINPDGREYFETRNTTGFTYIVDMCFFGDLVLLRPSYCGVVRNIPYTAG
jgi:hypothetical protein